MNGRVVFASAWLRAAGFALALALVQPGVSLAQAPLGSGVLQISGTTLRVSPESQTVPFDTPTLVNTELVGFEAGEGTLPFDLRVVGDLTGPEIDGVLELSTIPNEPFRIPRLSVKGQYRLDNIRLEQGGAHLSFAEPRNAGILVTQILITRVTSRPLTLEEIRSYGIVVDGTSTRAYNFTFGFGVEGEVVDYNVPILYWYEPEHPGQPRVDFVTSSVPSRFAPPRMAPFVLKLKPKPGPQTGGCADPGGCAQEEDPPLPGVILFPTDLTLLNQFFSVVLLATNGAPEGDPLVIRDLTAKIRLPSGLAAARTEPPTTLGTPVPMRVPGPDGKLGTADDLTFLIAQATAQAEFLVEGKREGTHIVDFDLEGVLEGLPTGVRRISGTARGAVVVRDPTLGVTVSHPDVVLADEEYTMEVTIANNGITPANLIRLALPPSQLAGVQVIGESQRTIEALLPGEAEVVEFRLRPQLTGRVIATFVRADNHVEPTFNLRVGIGEAGVPLSPTEIILPKEVESLPPQLRRHGLGLAGLGFSLATAPAALRSNRPQVSRPEVDQRVFELSQAGRHIALGDDPFDSAAELAVLWSGGPELQWEWDSLRRITRRGALFGDALGQVFREAASTTSATAAFERFARSTAATAPVALAVSDGTGSYLEITSRSSGKRLKGPGTAADRERDLPFGDLYDLGSGELALLAAPEALGYRVELRRRTAGVADLRVLVPGFGGQLEVWSWSSVGLGPNGRAKVDVGYADASPELAIDDDGDGTIDDVVVGAIVELSPRPFSVISATQNARADKTGHVVDVLFSAPVDFSALHPRDSARFALEGKVSDGGTSTAGAGALEAFRPRRIVRVVFNNPLSPYSEHVLAVRDVRSALGQYVVPQELDVAITATMPGTIVEGRLINASGQPIPFARVELAEVDYSNLPAIEDPCIKHVTAAMRTDADGRFRFDYVRQTECGGSFELRGFEPGTGNAGKVFGKVRHIGQVVELDIVLLGRGLVRGRVTYDDGSVPSEVRVVASSPVFLEARQARVDASGNYDVGDLPVGTISLSAGDGGGNFALATVEIETAGDVVERNLVLPRRSAGPTGSVRGHVYETDGEVLVYNAYLALYVGGHLVDVRRSDVQGAFDFGTVPAGAAEIEAFDAETGRSGARIYFQVEPDQTSDLSLQLRTERGVVEGHVFRRQLNGGATPMQGVVVHLMGQPFHTTTDGTGYYRLENVVGGRAEIRAADLITQTEITESVLLTGDGFALRKDLYFPLEASLGGIAGEFLDRSGMPIAGGVVHIAAGDVSWIHETSTDGQGRFAFPEIAPGTYSVHAFRNAEGASSRVTVQYPGHTPFVQVRVRKGGLVGTVRAAQEAGEPTGVRSIVRYRATVVRFGLVGLDTESHDLETDASGNWTLPDLLAGPYVVEIFNAFYGQRSFAGLIVNEGEAVRHDVLYELSGTVSGVLYRPDGVTPAAGASVRLAHPAFGNYTVTSDEQGRFRFEGIPPLSRSFAIRAHLEEATVYRDAEIWAVLRRHGERLDVSMTLPVQGSIQGRLETAAGQPVIGAAIRLRGREYPHQDLLVQSDSSGSFAFSNVMAGQASISAQTLSGLGGRTTTGIAVEGEERAALIRVESVGAVTGRVISPVDGAVAPNSQVQLFRGSSFFDAATADAQGRFLFDALPMATYSLRALDPLTGRSGRVGGLALDYEGEVLEHDIRLEARGSVHGALIDPSGHVPVPAATVRLNSLGIVSFSTFATTDFDGRFEFDGIPQGLFTLSATEPGGIRRAASAGEIVEEDQIVERDLVLQESGIVTGRILEPVAGSSIVFAGASSVALYQGSRLVGGSATNPYSIGGVLADQSFSLYAYELGGPRRGTATGVLHDEGEEVVVDVRLWPIGSVRITVTDGAGVSMPGAEVKLTASGPYGSHRYSATADAQGVVTFQQVGSGNLSASAIDPLSQLRGSVTGTLAVDGQEVALPIVLEPSAELLATVLLAHGLTPASETQVVVRISGRTYYSVTDDMGRFHFEALPLGAFSFDLVEHLGPGEWHGSGTLPSTGFVRDLGTIVLDAESPQVEQISPSNGAVGVPLASAISVVFSEPIATTFQNGWVELRKLGSSLVGTSSTWSADRRTLTLTPSVALQSFTSYQVRVKTLISDAAGRFLPALVQTSFTTIDALPPRVLSSLPVQGARNVPVDVQFRLIFSEAVTLESLSGSAIQLTDLDDQVGIATTFTLQPQNREVLVTPVGALVADHVHRLTVRGVRDGVGNVMTLPFVLEVETADVTPPVIGAILPGAGATVTSGQPIEISAIVTDNQVPATVTFRFLGRTQVAPPPASGASYRWNLTVPPVAEATLATLEVEARDPAGNLAVAASVIDVQPLLDPDSPQLSIACPTAGALLAPGTGLWINALASDEQGLLSVEFFLGESTLPVATLTTPPFRYRLTAPGAAREGELLAVRVVATDYGLKATEATRVVRIVEGAVLPGSRTIASNDYTFDGGSLIVAAGTVTIDGSHTFRDLVVLDGATLNHREATPAAEYELDVDLDRDLFVSCEGAIDTTGQGYLGGARHAGRAFGFGNSQTEGANFATGASHGGRGGAYDGSSRTYGNLFDPSAPGAGAGGSAAAAGSDGGGVVRISAGGAAVVDGAIRANGASNLAPGAAGGSIRLDALSISGAGVVEANGGPGGGGGRIALRAGAVEAGVLSRTRAWGGQRTDSGGGAHLQGAAGTVLVRRGALLFGELIVDNRGLLSNHWTELPSVGRGIVDAVSVDTMTDLEARFRSSVAGSAVYFDGNTASSWSVLDHAHEGQTLSLDVSGAPLTAGPGSTYAGLLRFDQVTVRGMAKARAADEVEVEETAQVEAEAVWSPDYAPPTLAVPDLDLSEGTGGLAVADLVITLSRPTDEVAHFSFRAIAESATEGEDFVASTGSVTIALGQSSARISLRIVADTSIEADESLRIELFDPTGVALPSAPVRVTIRDDDGDTHCAAPELLVNGGAEDQPFGGDVPGWVEESGSNWTATESLAHTGARFFDPRNFACPGRLRQDVDLTAFASAIDAGGFRLAFGASIYSGAAANPDSTEVEIELLDGLNGSILARYSSGEQRSVGVWSRVGALLDVPLGTRLARVRLIARGTACGSRLFSAFFDSLTLAPFDFASIAVGNGAVAEGTGAGATAIQFPVVLSCARAASASVQATTIAGTAASSADFVAHSIELSFGSDDTTQPVSVAIERDAVDELDETFGLHLTGAVGAFLHRASALGTIVDDDAATLSVADRSIVEGTGGANVGSIEVSLSTPSAQAVTVVASATGLTATAPADFSAASAVLTFAPGDTSEALSISIVTDAIDEGDETLIVTLSSPSGAAIANPTATIALVDDDENRLSVADVSVAEGTESSSEAVVAIQLSSPALADIEVAYLLEGQTAHPGVDFVAASGNGTIAAGLSTLLVPVSTIADSAIEATETLRLVVTGAPGVTLFDPIGIVTILDDDLTASIADLARDELDFGSQVWQFQVALSGLAPSQVSIAFATAELPPGDPERARAPGDFTASAGTLLLPAGSTGGTVDITVRGDFLDELDERFLVQLSAPVGVRLVDAEATARILDNEAPSAAFTSPAAYDVLDSAQPIEIRLTAADIAGIVGVTFEFAGEKFLDTQAPYEWLRLTPSPAALTDYTISASVEDGLGNSNVATLPIQVRAVPIPPEMHPELVTMGLDLFGLAAIGGPGAVVDPTDAPIFVVARNLSSEVETWGYVNVDGSFSVRLQGEDGESFTLKAVDSAYFESDAASLGPIVGDDGQVARLDSLGALAAADANEIAVCDCQLGQREDKPNGESNRAESGHSLPGITQPSRLDGPGNLYGNFSLSLFDASSGLEPTTLGQLSFPFDQVSAACHLGEGSCFDTCSQIVTTETCYPACAAGCGEEDWECEQLCFATCAEPGYSACSSSCQQGSTVCEGSGTCVVAAAFCEDSCLASPNPAHCEAACDAWESACDVDWPAFHPFPFNGFDYESRVAAVAQGPYLRIIDFRVPELPVLQDELQSLALLPLEDLGQNGLVDVKLEGGYAYTVERNSPNRLFVVDVHDPATPTLVATTPLLVGNVEQMAIADRRLHLLARIGTEVRHHRFSLGEIGDIFPTSTSAPIAVSDWEPATKTVSEIVVVEQLATFVPLQSSLGIVTVHADQANGSAARSSSLDERTCTSASTFELGDRFLVGCSGLVGDGTLDESVELHGYTLGRWLSEPPGANPVGTMLQSEGRIWTFPGGSGFLSAPLWPWLDQGKLSLTLAPSGAVLAGAAGAAREATTVVAQTELGSFEAPVETDGAFTVLIPGDMRGISVRIQAKNGAHGGNRLRLRVPLGNPAGELILADEGGARYAARGAAISVVVTPELDGLGRSRLHVLSHATGLIELAEIEVEGPVSGVVLVGDVLYVAGHRLTVIHLADPSQPALATELTPFGGNAISSIAAHSGRLWALGAEGSASRLLPFDLTTPLAPQPIPSQSALVQTVPESRLLVAVGDLYRVGAERIERFDTPESGPVSVAASGSREGTVFVDLAHAGDDLVVAARSVGTLSLSESAGVISLSPAPVPGHGAAGLFVLQGGSGGAIWRASGLSGAVRLEGGRMAPVGCELIDAVPGDGDLLLLTACGVERVELP